MGRVCRYARRMTPPAGRPTPTLAERLAQRTLELVDIPSESLHEAAVRSHLLSLVPPEFAPEYAAEDAFVFARPRRPAVPLALLVGHYDTVPAQDNVPGRIADGAVHGCGATDMKGGVAVAIELVRDLRPARIRARSTSRCSSSARRSCPRTSARCPDLFERSLLAPAADLAILLEPTDLTIQAGCLGNMDATSHLLRGQRPLGAALDGRERDREGDRGAGADRRARAPRGDRRRAAVLRGRSITRLDAGIADNVIPDRAVATLNFRYAPDRTPGERGRLPPGSLTPAGATLEITGDSPPARGRHGHAARPRAARRRRPRLRAEAGVDERGGLHDAAGSTRSTSARARRATHIAATSSSRSTPSCTAYDTLHRVPHQA